MAPQRSRKSRRSANRGNRQISRVSQNLGLIPTKFTPSSDPPTIVFNKRNSVILSYEAPAQPDKTVFLTYDKVKSLLQVQYMHGASVPYFFIISKVELWGSSAGEPLTVIDLSSGVAANDAGTTFSSRARVGFNYPKNAQKVLDYQSTGNFLSYVMEQLGPLTEVKAIGRIHVTFWPTEKLSGSSA